MPKVSRRRVTNRVSKSCVVMTLVGFALIAVLALAMCFIFGSLKSQNTDQEQPRGLHNNLHDGVPEPNSRSEDEPTMTVVLIVFSLIAVVLATVLIIVCITIVRSFREQKEKFEKNGKLIPDTYVNKTTEDTEQFLHANIKDIEQKREVDDNTDDNDDETCCKELLLQQNSNTQRRSAICKVNQVNECNVKVHRNNLKKSVTFSQKLEKKNSHFAITNQRYKQNENNNKNKSEDEHVLKDTCITLKNDNGNSTISTSIIAEKDDVAIDEPKVVVAHHAKTASPISGEDNKCAKVDYLHEVEKRTEESEIPLETKASIDEANLKDVEHVITTCQNTGEDKKCTALDVLCESEKQTNEQEIPVETKPLLQQEDGNDTDKDSSADIIKHQDENFHGRLNWNKVFAFLASIMPPTNHEIFFIILCDSEHDSQGRSISTIIKQVDYDAKGLETQSRMLRQFQKWKQLMGERAKIQHIRAALEEMQYKDVVHELEKFMRNPPLFPEQTNNPSSEIQLLDENNPTLTPRDIHFRSSLFGVKWSDKNGSQTLFCQKQDTKGTSISAVDCHNFTAMNPMLRSNFKAIRRKRHISKTESSTDHEIVCKPIKSRRLHKKSQRISKRHSHSKAKYPHRCDRSVRLENLLLDFIKRSILKDDVIKEEKDCYHLFMRHTVKVITKDTKKSEEEILSLTCDDIAKYEKKVSRHGHIAYIIDIENDFLVLHKDEWEYLELYKIQRKKVCARKVSENRDYADSKYLFINYDGQPLKEPTEGKTKDEESDQTESNSSETTETSTEQSDDVYDKPLFNANRNSRENHERTFRSQCQSSKEFDGKIENPETVVSDSHRSENCESIEETKYSQRDKRKIMDIVLD